MAVKTNAPWMTIYCDETHLLFRKAKQNTVAHFKNVITGELYELLPGHNISPSGEAYSYCVNGLRNGMHYLAYAFMHRDVVFCEPAWTSPRWQKPLPTILEEDVQTPTLAHTRLDQYDSLGTILLHELTHTKLLGDDLTKDHDVLVRGQKRDCYDWQSCAALAKCCRQKPLTSAESYVIFAKALFLAPYDWSTGWANGKPPNGKKKSKPKRPLENPPLPDDDDVRPEKRPHRDEGTPDSEFASSETVEDLGWVWTAT
ncbi:MAG: hypothetical protein M1833_000375 [Piccolia ochrophora]|nr:MAG: hypothetical protein M1833_000375 [Piccolia ochrophora]